MTKYVRIENADMSSFKIKVRIQEKKWDAEVGKLTDEWVDVKEVKLEYPTSMANEYLTDSRRFIIEEFNA